MNEMTVYSGAINDDINQIFEGDNEHASDGFILNQSEQDLFKGHEKSLSDALRDDADESEEEIGGFKYLSSSQNLEIIKPNADLIDESKPYSSLAIAGEWMREALDLRNYYHAMEKLGEDVATYKFSYDEGKMGEFDAKKFAKETLKSAGRSFFSDTLNMLGNMFYMYGTNIIQQNKSDISPFVAGPINGVIGSLPHAGESLQKLGDVFREYAQNVEGWSFLAPSDEVYDDNPNFVKLANTIGGGASQVLAMGTVARAMGAKAAYGLFATGSAGEVFRESIEENNQVGKANLLALSEAGITYGIDRLFDPLPHQLTRQVKNTSQVIAKEMLGAPLREAGSEVLQQMLAENLVRKVGIDDTQDLFEGLIESALGAFAGSSVLTFGSGAVYLSSQSYEVAKQRILSKGVSAEELALTEQGMMQFLGKNYEVFDKVLSANLDRNLLILKQEALDAKNQKERAFKTEVAEGFPKLREAFHERVSEVISDAEEAQIAANVLSAEAIALYRMNNNLTPQDIMDRFMPSIKKMSYREFLLKTNPDAAISFMYGGIKAKKANLKSYVKAKVDDENNIDQQKIWTETGWFFGRDKKARFDFSHQNAHLKIWDVGKTEDRYSVNMAKSLTDVEKLAAEISQFLNKSEKDNYIGYYNQFWDYLQKNLGNVEYFKVARRQNGDLDQFGYDVISNNAFHDWVKTKDEKYKLEKFFYEKKDSVGYVHRGLDEVMFLLGPRKVFNKWFLNKNKEPNGHFMELIDHYKSFAPKKFDKLIALLKEKREKRKDSLLKYKMEDSPEFYKDLDFEEKYKIFKLVSGYKDPEDADMLKRKYKMEYLLRPAMSDMFLSDASFSQLTIKEKKDIAFFLNRVEALFRANQIYVRDRAKQSEYRRMVQSDLLYKKDNGLFDYRRKYRYPWIELNNGQKMKFEDLLDFDELYENYPQIKDAEISFVKLKDNAPYHFYINDDNSTVLEIDADLLNYADLKEILLKGANFAIEHIEGFEYSLSDQDKRNFMNREIILAKKKISDTLDSRLSLFLKKYPVNQNGNQYLSDKNMPVSLAGIFESRAVDSKALGDEVVSYKEIDFDKLRNDIDQYFSDEDRFLRKLALNELRVLQHQYLREIANEARAHGGYRSAGLPWQGWLFQGSIDQRELFGRFRYGKPYELKTPISELWFYKDPNLSSIETVNFSDEKPGFNVDLENVQADINQDIAKGAYEYATKTINLFEKGDADALIHESLHYFWDMMHQPEMQVNETAIPFFSVEDNLRQQFLAQYKAVYNRGLYYALDKKTFDFMDALPVGFPSEEALTDAAVRELFVERVREAIEGGDVSGIAFGSAVDFYRNFVKEMFGNLDVHQAQTSSAMDKFLNFVGFHKKSD